MNNGEKIIDDLHRIREEHYEETKHLTSEEKAAKLHEETADIIAELGLKTVSNRYELITGKK